MVLGRFTETDVEEAALEWLEGLGYSVLSGPEIAPGEPDSERDTYSDVVLETRLRLALLRLNPNVPSAALEDALRNILRADSPSLIANNHRFHRYLVNGVPVEHTATDGRIVYDNARLVDFDNPDNNNWLVVNQFTGGQRQSRS